MDIDKSFAVILSELLDEYRSLVPGAEIGEDSGPFVRYAATAAAIWGARNFAKYVGKQGLAFLGDAESESLNHWGYLVFGIPRNSGESDTAYLQRVKARIKTPPSGGTATDYESWAAGYEMPARSFSLQAAMLSASGLGQFSAANAIDGTVSEAWDTDAAAPGSYMVIDAGSPIQAVYCMLEMSAAGCQAIYAIEYSDDNSQWHAVTASFSPRFTGWNFAEWTPAGSHRYWRLRLTNLPGIGATVCNVGVYVSGSESVSYAKLAPIESQIPGTASLSVASNGGVASPALLVKMKQYLDTVRPHNDRWVSVRSVEFVTQAVPVYVYGACNSGALVSDITALINAKQPGVGLYSAEVIALAIKNGAANAYVSFIHIDVAYYQKLVAGNVTVSPA